MDPAPMLCKYYHIFNFIRFEEFFYSKEAKPFGLASLYWLNCVIEETDDNGYRTQEGSSDTGPKNARQSL